MTHKKQSAGDFKITTGDAKKSSKIISLCTLIKVAFLHVASVLASYLRGLA